MAETYYSVTYQPGSGDALVLYWLDSSPCSNCPSCDNNYAIAVYGQIIQRICTNVAVQITPNLTVVWNGIVSPANGFTVYGGGQEYLPVTPVQTNTGACTALAHYGGYFRQACAPVRPGISVGLVPLTYKLGSDKLVISTGQADACGATYSPPIYTLNYGNPVRLCQGNNKVSEYIYITWNGVSTDASAFLVYYQTNAVPTPLPDNPILTDCNYVTDASDCIVAPTGQYGPHPSSSHWWIWVLVGIGSLVILGAIIGLIVYFHSKT